MGRTIDNNTDKTTADVKEPIKESPYHHGNLKLALVDGYIELLSSTHPDKLSLRKLASHVGVAATAVYNHFADKNALMAAVRTRCLGHFADYLEEHYQEDACAEESFARLGKTYFRYASIHADYFHIIFTCPTQEAYVSEELTNAGMRAESKLRKTVTDLYKQFDLPSTQYTEGLGAFACWAMAHGITTLASLHVNRAACNNGRWHPDFMLNNEESVDAVFEGVGDILVAGLLARIRKYAEKPPVN